MCSLTHSVAAHAQRLLLPSEGATVAVVYSGTFFVSVTIKCVFLSLVGRMIKFLMVHSLVVYVCVYVYRTIIQY